MANICDAVNAVSAQGCTVAEIKRKWFDLKMEAKKHIAQAKRSMTTTGGGQQEVTISPIDQRIQEIIREVALTGKKVLFIDCHDKNKNPKEKKHLYFQHDPKVCSQMFHLTVMHRVCQWLKPPTQTRIRLPGILGTQAPTSNANTLVLKVHFVHSCRRYCINT